MSKTIRQLTVIGIALVGMLLFAATASAQTAKIAKIVGSGGATVVINGQSQPVTEGMDIPQNAVIATTNQEVYVEVATGVVASVKANSRVALTSLSGSNLELDLRQGSVVSQIDKSRMAGKTYGVRVGKGVAAARGTAYSVALSNNGFSIAATADTVQYTTDDGEKVTIHAGQITITPVGQPPQPAVSIANAANDPQVAAIIREAVHTVTTVVQNNLGEMSADSATNVIAQVVAVAVAALPSEATTFTSQAIQAVTASGSATAGTPDAAATAAGAVTAAAVQSAPDQAAQVAAAAASAAPNQTGVITAAAQQVAPTASDSIIQNVAAATGQSTTSVQSSASAASSVASTAVNAAKDATSNVVTQPTGAPSNAPSTPVTQPQTTPQVPVVQPDASNAGG